MRKLLICLLASLLFIPGCSGNAATVRASLGQEFTLTPGRSAQITGEDLTIEMLDVVEDSRCPKDVTCIWAGRASCIVAVSKGGTTEETVLTEPGLTFNAVSQQFQNYIFSFQIEPYPQAGTQIAKTDYRLVMTVTRK